MRVHVLQHVWFEGLGVIQDWISERQHTITYTKLYEDNAFPSVEEIDFLVVLGGPMSISETTKFPWLVGEKVFIKSFLESKKPMLGICLGAQFLAEALGASVLKGPHKEIGWFPVNFNTVSTAELGMKFIPETITPFHWHSETFTIPNGAVPLASSQAFQNQAFLFNKNVLALQFHLEVSRASCMKLVNNCRIDLTLSKWVQSEDYITTGFDIPRENIRIMKMLLDFITR